MWVYEKKLMYPIKIKNPCARLATIVMDQYGGPDGKMNLLKRACLSHFNGIVKIIGNKDLFVFRNFNLVN